MSGNGSRVKVELKYARNIFYQKLLESWRSDLEDGNNFRSVLYNAKVGMSQCPIEAGDPETLRNVKGIGDKIATRLEACWELFSTEHGAQANSVSYARSVINEDLCRRILRDSEQPVRGRGRPAVTGDPLSKPSSSTAPANKRAHSNKSDETQISKKHSFTRSVSSLSSECHSSSGILTSSLPVQSRQNSSSSLCAEKENSGSAPELTFVTIHSTEIAEVILIADCREDSRRGAKSSVVENLEKDKALRVARRALSVGDYMWVARKLDGSEMVLDWVVERKTWDDLDSSIRNTRYEEQKRRLRQAPFTRRVYLVEGGTAWPNPSEKLLRCQQALLTTAVAGDGFLIQRCLSTHKTAQFLSTLTQKLMKETRGRTMTNLSFESVQEMCKKTQDSQTVADAWLRMMTVIPGISAESASRIVEVLPSLRAAADYFKDSAHSAESLVKVIPGLTRVPASNLAKFFGR